MFLLIFTCILYHITRKVLEYRLNMRKAEEKLFLNAHEGPGSELEDCHEAFKKLVRTLRTDNLINL